MNEDDTEHSFTLDDDSVDQDVGGAARPSRSTVTAAGPFHCTIHPHDEGNVTVG